MPETIRQLSPLDKLLTQIQQLVQGCTQRKHHAERPNPASDLSEPNLSIQQQKQAAGLMRVNHAGEIAAQALYQGHAITARDENNRQLMQQSAVEEEDHLAWCEQRLGELNSQPSKLQPLWYTGSLLIGVASGLAGDKWSLGFVEETEYQVIKHLDTHLDQLPPQDKKSATILRQMREDEAHHAAKAQQAGAATLPTPLKIAMHFTAKIMTKTAYWI